MPSRRVELLGCPLDPVTMQEALERCERAIAERSYLQHMSVNVAKLVSLRDDPFLRSAVGACGLVTADGQGVVWAARLLGLRAPERVAGIDLMFGLLERAERNRHRVFILGARPEVLERALASLRAAYPRLEIAGARDGYFSDEEAPEVCAEIRAARPDMLFVAMSSPRKEYFLDQHGPGLGVPFAMGVGGSVDVIAGLTRRAPLAVQRLGLEWLYRLGQEPRRLARRYLLTNVRFAGMVAWALVCRRRDRAALAR